MERCMPIVQPIVQTTCGGTGGISAEAFIGLYKNLTLVYDFDGLSSERTIVHGKGYYVDATFLMSDDTLVYPKYVQPDVNTIIVLTNIPLVGKLYVK